MRIRGYAEIDVLSKISQISPLVFSRTKSKTNGNQTRPDVRTCRLRSSLVGDVVLPAPSGKKRSFKDGDAQQLSSVGLTPVYRRPTPYFTARYCYRRLRTNLGTTHWVHQDVMVFSWEPNKV